jgi:hypothetical protein
MRSDSTGTTRHLFNNPWITHIYYITNAKRDFLINTSKSQASAVTHGNVIWAVGVFPPVGLEKPMELSEPFLAYVITLVSKHTKFGWNRFTRGAATQW